MESNDGTGTTTADDLAAKRAAAAAKEAERVALENAKPLSAADILSTDDAATEWVRVPEWGGKVLVKALTGTERDQFEASLVMKRAGVGGKMTRELSTLDIRAKLCQLTIVDPTDEAKRRPAFQGAQIAALGAKSAAALSRVYDVAARLSGLSEADVEELAGNSPTADSGVSSSSSV